MAPLVKSILIGIALLATGAQAHAQLLGGRSLGGLAPAGPGALPNVPIVTAPRIAPVPPAQNLPLPGAVVAPLSTIVPATTAPIDNTANTLGQTVQGIATGTTRDLVGRPLNQLPPSRDDQGHPIVQNEILAVSPTPESLATARRLNFGIVRQDQLSALNLAVTILRAPEGLTESQALAAIRQADPAGNYDYANIYNPSGGQTVEEDSASRPTALSPAHPALRIGMIDGGIEAHHSAFSNTRIVSRNFASPGETLATAHGTAVASLLAGSDKDFSGYLSGATVYAADVFGGQASGGSAAEIAQALNWLAENGVPVVNISLAGPANALLEAAVKAFVGSGHVLVAATGNDGPAARPNYPAAYAGVIGVTASDAGHHFALDANRNAARFTAIGVGIKAAALPSGYDKVSGTSYASPLVAARFALLVPAPGNDNCLAALSTLTHDTVLMPNSTIGYLAPPSGQLAQR
jgi:hypothetical protein